MRKCISASCVTLTEFSAASGAPIVCTMEKGELESRAAGFRTAFTQLIATERVIGGFRWAFRRSDEFEETLRRLAAREHQCCSFVTFKLFREGDHLIWETTGPEEAQQAIEFFYSLPESVQHGPDGVRHIAESSGLLLAADGSERSTG